MSTHPGSLYVGRRDSGTLFVIFVSEVLEDGTQKAAVIDVDVAKARALASAVP